MREAVSQPFKMVCHFSLVINHFNNVPRQFFSGSQPGFKVIGRFSCSTLLSMKFILLINVKTPTIIGILTFIIRINE